MTLNEHDFLEAAGVWMSYERLTNKESQIKQLKETKQATELKLWMLR